MKNKKITRKITQGVYVLTTIGGGCVVDAVSQVSAGDEPLIAAAVMKKNYTNELLHKTRKFALSVLGKDVSGEIIQTFGLQSMRDVNKFERIATEDVNEVPIILDSLGYMLCDVVETFENDTHTLFIGRLLEADVFQEAEELSYQYYQNHKEEILKFTNEEGKTAWVCSVCGYVYYGEELPADFVCPVCGVTSELFRRK